MLPADAAAVVAVDARGDGEALASCLDGQKRTAGAVEGLGETGEELGRFAPLPAALVEVGLHGLLELDALGRDLP
ncbi:hypothetical protein [Kitasatospora sp. NPDC058218]|uniref:hypothetical protein n=1 Tax=Kitasatospora sp. NPDC058218 TaxID=3346385 RepID=UPI0036DB58A0